MGTDKALKLGKAYTVNSEFYTQPKQALGYVLKEYFGVNPTRWVADNSKNLDIPLVSNKKITQYGFQMASQPLLRASCRSSHSPGWSC